ncbi:MAG: hypothetical protein QXD48_02775 [Candidatus Aenigmatarchaeota archaeon]
MQKEAFLEIVALKCPKCNNEIIEPSWFVDLEQEIQCADCKEFFVSKENEKDRKMIRIIIEDDKINHVELKS